MGLVKQENRNNIGVLRFDNGVTNAVSPDLAVELTDLLRKVAGECRGMVLAGGEKFFCIGFDLPKLLEMDRDSLGDLFHRYDRILLDLYTLPIPTACAVKGHCIGAGTTFLLACDYRYAASGRTLFGLNEITLGLPVPYLADMTLRQITGDRIATDVLYNGELFDSVEAERFGILNEIHPKEDVERIALERMEGLCRLPPMAFAAIKANRVEAIRVRHRKHHAAKIESLLDCWFDGRTRELLQEAVKKF